MPKIASMIPGTRVTSAPVAEAREDGTAASPARVTDTRQTTGPAPRTGPDPQPQTGVKPKTRPTKGETATGKGY